MKCLSSRVLKSESYLSGELSVAYHWRVLYELKPTCDTHKAIFETEKERLISGKVPP
jgi:hypothetical protein